MRRSIVLALALLALSPLPAADLVPLRKSLVEAIAAKDQDRVGRAAADLVAEGSATAAEILIVDGLLSDHPPSEATVREALAKLSPGPALDWLCTRCTQHEREEVRDQLVRVLAPRSEKNAFAAVLTCLFDDSVAVKVSTVLALEEKNHRGAIPHLIRALEREEQLEQELGQVAGELRRLLERWTGKELFGSGEYQRLWRDLEAELLDPENQKKKDPLEGIEWEFHGTTVGARYPEFFGQELLSQQIVFVLDTSISMKAEDPPPPPVEKPGGAGEGAGGGTTVGGGGKPGAGKRTEHRGPRQRLRRVQNELVRLVSDLPEGFRFSIVSFDQEVSVFSKGLQPANPETKRRAIAFVRDFDADGETWTDRALETAFEVSGVRTIVLLSDGMPFRSDGPIHVPSLLDWVETRNRFAHVEIHTIGFARTSGEVGGFLKELARRNRGKYTEIP